MALLDDIKTALQISTNTFDSELTDLISAGVTDLNIDGVYLRGIPTIKSGVIPNKFLCGDEQYVLQRFQR